MEPERKSLRVEIKDAEKGLVRAVFAKLKVKDHDNDWTLPGAFGEQKVRVSAYEHGSWGMMGGRLPVGKGTISEKGDEAVADLKFFMSTQHGREHFEVVKEMGDLQEWSYGYDVLEEGEVTEDLRQKGVTRVLKKLKVNEVSPVLLGAGVGTRTLAVKGENNKEKDSDVKPEETKTTKLGELLTKLRDEQEVSNGEIAEAMGVSATEVKRILEGGVVRPSLSCLDKLAAALKTSFGRLRWAAEMDGMDYADEDEMRSRGVAAEEARKAALKAEELWKSAEAEAKAAIEAKTSAEAKAAIERGEAFQADAQAEFARFNRNMERYLA